MRSSRRAEVLYDFKANDEDQLTIRPGETVEIIEVSPDFNGWALAKKGSIEGFIPSEFVTYANDHILSVVLEAMGLKSKTDLRGLSDEVMFNRGVYDLLYSQFSPQEVSAFRKECLTPLFGHRTRKMGHIPKSFSDTVVMGEVMEIQRTILKSLTHATQVLEDIDSVSFATKEDVIVAVETMCSSLQTKKQQLLDHIEESRVAKKREYTEIVQNLSGVLDRLNVDLSRKTGGGTSTTSLSADWRVRGRIETLRTEIIRRHSEILECTRPESKKGDEESEALDVRSGTQISRQKLFRIRLNEALFTSSLSQFVGIESESGRDIFVISEETDDVEQVDFRINLVEEDVCKTGGVPQCRQRR